MTEDMAQLMLRELRTDGFLNTGMREALRLGIKALQHIAQAERDARHHQRLSGRVIENDQDEGM